MKLLLWLLSAGVIIYILLCLFVYYKQASLIFFPDTPGRELIATPGDIGLAYEDVYLRTEDGVKLHAWFISHDRAKRTVLFSHGNAGNISHRLDSIRIFHELGFNVLIYDYRGYGQSEGTLSEAGTYLDVRAGWDYLIGTRQHQAQQIILFGRSLGAAMASRLATQVKPAALILESAFASVPDMAATLYPFLPIRWISRFEYSNVQHVKKITAPLLVIHSKADELIPWQQGRKIYTTANEPKSWLEIQGGHNDGFMVSYEIYLNGLRNFLNQHPGNARQIK